MRITARDKATGKRAQERLAPLGIMGLELRASSIAFVFGMFEGFQGDLNGDDSLEMR